MANQNPAAGNVLLGGTIPGLLRTDPFRPRDYSGPQHNTNMMLIQVMKYKDDSAIDWRNVDIRLEVNCTDRDGSLDDDFNSYWSRYFTRSTLLDDLEHRAGNTLGLIVPAWGINDLGWAVHVFCTRNAWYRLTVPIDVDGSGVETTTSPRVVVRVAF